MGVLDKIKNALFEVEYVEVEEPVKKEKKVKPKEKTTVVNDKPIAKKVVLPGKKETKVESLEEEELKDDNYESRPKDETIKENNHDEFKFMDDNDFKVDDEYSHPEPEIVKVIDNNDNRSNEDSYSNRGKNKNDSRTEVLDSYEQNEVEHLDNAYNNKAYSNHHETKLYGLDSSYSVPVHEYGTYDKKEEKTYFKPSPIISPIYGILDKNYKKEDVVPKKEVRIASSYTRSNVSVDDVRDKAYGSHQDETINEIDTKFEVDDEDDDENLLVDLSDNNDKPEVKELTMGDALEYFQDLGLEYNVDYVDASKEKTVGRRVKDNYDDIVEDTTDDYKKDVKISKHDDYEISDDKEVIEEKHDNEEEKKSSSNVVEIKKESNTDNSLDDDDNLFDLIDSMYQEND